MPMHPEVLELIEAVVVLGLCPPFELITILSTSETGDGRRRVQVQGALL